MLKYIKITSNMFSYIFSQDLFLSDNVCYFLRYMYWRGQMTLDNLGADFKTGK